MRDVARRHGLATAEKPESQEICFVPGGDYREALRERAGWQETPGPLLDADGARVGEHRGAAAYTVGQRTGLGVALGERRYVGSIDAAHQPRHARRGARTSRSSEFSRGGRSLRCRGAAGADEFEAEVRIRHRAEPVPGVVRRATTTEPDRGGRWSVELERPAWAPAPGQAAVFYRGDEVIGGGRIA